MHDINKQNIKRYTAFDFPTYRYIPKQGIHPSKSLDKIHIPKLLEELENFTCNSWNYNQRYLYAIDLFNYGYYWEVHEVLEKLWKDAGKKSPEGVYIQGIIQLSVALLKNLQSNLNGVNRLKEKAMPKLLSQLDIYLGVDVENLLKQFDAFIHNEQENPPLIKLSFN